MIFFHNIQFLLRPPEYVVASPSETENKEIWKYLGPEYASEDADIWLEGNIVDRSLIGVESGIQ